MEKPQLDEVYSALKALYQPGEDKSGKEKASTYLGLVQQSVWSWELADTLLSQNKGRESSYFAAHTLRMKIQREFRELPDSSHLSLRDSLMNHLDSFQEGPVVIVTQLCLALADLAIQMSAWDTVVQDLITRLSPSPKAWIVLLECLTVLPEEVGSRYLRLGTNRRDEIQCQLQQQSNNVMSLLEYVCTNYSMVQSERNDALFTHLFRCWGSWLVLGSFDAKTVASGSILTKIFEVVITSPSSHTCHEAACDAICSATYAMEDLHVNRELALQLVPRLHSLQKPLKDAIDNLDTDSVVNITRMLTEAGESLLTPLTCTPGQELGDLTIVSLILTCVKYQEYEVAEISFNFWFQLAEHIYRTPDNKVVETYKPVFMELLNTLITTCELEEGFDPLHHENEDYVEYREKCGDLLRDTVHILGVSAVLDLLYSKLTPTSQWREAEAVLFCISCVVRLRLMNSESHVLPKLLETVLGVPAEANVNLQITAVKVVGELSSWISEHPQLLETILQYILRGLGHPKQSEHCITALQKVAFHSKHHLLQHLDLLVRVSEAGVKVPTEVYCKYIESIVGVICSLPVTQQSEHLLRLANSSITALGNNTGDPTPQIDALCSIFKGYTTELTLTEPHPLGPVLVASWPHLSVTMTRCSESVTRIERMCRCIRYGIRAVNMRASSILGPLAEQLVQLYTVHPHSCVLYLSSILVDEFAGDTNYHVGLLGLLSALGPITFSILTTPQGLEQNPDTVDDFYRLCSRYIQHLGTRLVSSDLMPHLMELATMSLMIQHKDAQCSAVKFLDSILNKGVSEKCPACTEHMKSYGQKIMNNIILGVSGGLPSMLITDTTLLLHDMLTMIGEEARQWLQNALSTIPLGTYVTQHHVEELYNNLTTETNGRNVMRTCKEFSQYFT